MVVELGSWLGLSARFFLDIAPNAMVICVDHWQGSLEHHHDEKWRKMLPTLYETFLVNLWSYRDRIIPLKAGTIEGLKLIHSLGIHPDLIYIDASHEYDAVFQDVQTAMALFPKSTICGDDWSWDGVRQAVTENATHFQQTVFTEGGHAWYFQGTSHELTDPTYFTHCGIVLKSLERYQEAKDAFKKALTLNPDNADAWSNLGQVMLILKQDQGHIESAFRRAIRLEPQHSDAHCYLASLLHLQGKTREALTCLEQAKAFCKTSPFYHYTYGVVLKHEKRFEEAIVSLETSFRLDPNYLNAWWQMAMLLHEIERPFAQIEQALANVLRLQSNHGDALSLLADIRQKQGRHEEAISVLQKLVSLHPEDLSVHERISQNYASDHKPHEALNYLADKGITEKEEPEWLHFLAVQHGECGNTEQSKIYFRRVFEISKNPVHRWKHLWYCPVFFDSKEEIDRYWMNLNHDLDMAIAESPVFDWRQLPHEGFTSSFHLPHHYRCCRDIKEKFATLLEKSFFFQRPKSRYAKRTDGKIRVGFLVTPGHEGGFVRMMRGIMERLNPNRYEVFLFYHQDFGHRFHDMKKDECLHHITYSWWFEQAIQRIREVGCDILYHWKVAADLWSTFLPMTYLGPVQCTAWGTHGTGGIPHVDYSLTWDHAEIPEAQEHYTETLFRLATPPNFEVFEKRPKNVSRSELGLPKHSPD